GDYRELRSPPTRRASDLPDARAVAAVEGEDMAVLVGDVDVARVGGDAAVGRDVARPDDVPGPRIERGQLALIARRVDRVRQHDRDRKSTRLNSSHVKISY